MELHENLKGFSVHGAVFDSIKGNQALGLCPLCGKDGHFYVNIENRLWDCKRCGANGNFSQFLSAICKRNVEALDDKKLIALAASRGLPKSAFDRWEIGFDGKDYTLPVRSYKGQFEDLRRWRPGQKTKATSGATLGLLGAQHLASKPGEPVYICEGEWDAIAFVWLARKLEVKASAVAVPGATVFKNEWVPLFHGRTVYLLHDNDQAGENGRSMCFKKLQGVAKAIYQIRWPEKLPQGFDIRDLICTEAIREKRPRAAWQSIQKLLVPAGETVPGEIPPEGPKAAPKKPSGPIPPAQEVFAAYQKWLHLHNDDPLRVLFGSVFANRIQGEPIWLFLVAPPGGCKSELLMSLSNHYTIETTTSLTTHTLVSGANFHAGVDPSLVPKLDGRILVVKDFTTILTMHFASRDEIFGVLRDCYDGKTEKNFGTGLKRSYVSHFGILAGVTPKIEEFGVVHQSLGERFLKYRLNTGEKEEGEAVLIRRALKNINKEAHMREDLCRAANRVLDAAAPTALPEITEIYFERIINLAQVCAMMRGVVERDRYTQQVIYKPSTEVGTRLAKQLAKLAIGVAIYLKRDFVDEDIYKLIRKVALDTAPDRVEEVVRQLWTGTPHELDALKTSDISARTRLPVSTCFRILQDLELLKLVNRIGTGNKYEWRLGSSITKLIEAGNVYARSGI